MYPRDRVVLNEVGRVRFLMRDYSGAVEALGRVLSVDPEDLQGHYTLMLAYRGLGDKEKAVREQKLFIRFKADEASQTITARRRMLSPEDNNERQPIHDHVSAPARRPQSSLPQARIRVRARGGLNHDSEISDLTEHSFVVWRAPPSPSPTSRQSRHQV